MVTYYIPLIKRSAPNFGILFSKFATNDCILYKPLIWIFVKDFHKKHFISIFYLQKQIYYYVEFFIEKLHLH